jgi:antitoxin (DNA-binding transcriptional repressor) of toxin-antitoxin stability system
MGKLRTISMLDLRQRAETIIGEVKRGQTMVLTYRGRPALRLEPIRPDTAAQDDPFYRLADLADTRGRSLTNGEIDDIVYGS